MSTVTEVFDLRQQNLTEFPESLRQHAKTAKVILLGKNQLRVIPSFIEEFEALEELDLSKNGLTTLPPQLGQLPKLKYLFVDGNPSLRIPQVIAPPPTKAFYRYMFALLGWFDEPVHGMARSFLRAARGPTFIPYLGITVPTVSQSSMLLSVVMFLAAVTLTPLYLTLPLAFLPIYFMHLTRLVVSSAQHPPPCPSNIFLIEGFALIFTLTYGRGTEQLLRVVGFGFIGTIALAFGSPLPIAAGAAFAPNLLGMTHNAILVAAFLPWSFLYHVQRETKLKLENLAR